MWGQMEEWEDRGGFEVRSARPGPPLTVLHLQGQDGTKGDRGEDGEPGQPVSTCDPHRRPSPLSCAHT